MHDDQYGTAIISVAVLINFVQIANKNIENVKMVVNGAGIAAIDYSIYFISDEKIKKSDV